MFLWLWFHSLWCLSESVNLRFGWVDLIHRCLYHFHLPYLPRVPWFTDWYQYSTLLWFGKSLPSLPNSLYFIYRSLSIFWISHLFTLWVKCLGYFSSWMRYLFKLTRFDWVIQIRQFSLEFTNLSRRSEFRLSHLWDHLQYLLLG